MVAASGEVKTQVGFMYRFGAAIRRWEETEAGTVGLFAGSFHANALHSPWWRERALSGGQVVEQLIHLIDLVRVHMGEPQTVYARAANLFHMGVPRYTSEDASAIVFGFADDRIATLNASNGAVPGKWIKRWHIVAERATGEFSDWNTGMITHTAGEVCSEAIAGTEDVFLLQMRDLIGAIREDRPTRTPMSEGAASLRLALAARRSAEERREVAL
jgi:predicted dehydrogenase